MKSGPLSRYASIALASSVGRHRHQLLAGALRDLVVHLFLKQRQPRRARQAEADRIRAAPADDVAGGEDARTDCPTGGDAIANRDERPQHAVAVAHRRDAVRQLRLRCFEDDFRLAIVIADQRFVAIVHATVERQVHIRVHEAGDEELAARRRSSARRRAPASTRADPPRRCGRR